MHLTRSFATTGVRSIELGSVVQAGCLVRIYPAEGIGEVFELDERPLTIGREADCDIALDDDSVSRHHATIEATSGGHVITDLGSTNGVYVGDVRVDRRRLVPNDRIRLGQQILKYLSTDRIEAQYHELVYKAMTTDGLTQLFNKRYLMEVLERELARCRRTGRPSSVLMVDIDRFKLVNDQYGHLVGDGVLVEFARRAKTLLRHDEILARFGGEEFVLVLADTPLDSARLAAERLRQAISSTPFATERATVPVTVSIGVAQTHGESTEQAITLLERADAMLYAAKQAGRDRVMG